jgi:(p)ppGpp synthase/HD superfamily hydrolase
MEDQKSLLEVKILPIEAKMLKLLPLSGITHKHGVDGLLKLAINELEEIGPDAKEKVGAAIELAAMFHWRDTYKDMPYLTHLLRVTLRLIRDYSITDATILSAAVLHDSVEDHGEEIIAYTGYKFKTPEDALASLVGHETANIVNHLSNTPTPTRLDQAAKNLHYLEGIRHKLYVSYKVFIIKLSDFSDNAVGIHWGEDYTKSAKVAAKYLPVFEVFEEACRHYLSSGELSQAHYDYAMKQLENGRKRCELILS